MDKYIMYFCTGAPFHYRWQDVVEDQYVLHIIPPKLPLNINQLATKKAQTPPPNWSFECDEELVKFLSDNVTEAHRGNTKRFIERIEVSSVRNIIFHDSLSLTIGDLARPPFKVVCLSGLTLHNISFQVPFCLSSCLVLESIDVLYLPLFQLFYSQLHPKM